MSRIKVADFYYGSVLSMLFNSNLTPALVESNNDRQIYMVTVNQGECMLYIKYRGDKSILKNQDYHSWQFTFSQKEVSELESILRDGRNLAMALVCGVEGLSDSEIAVLDVQEVRELLNLNKTSITISRKKNERYYRISVGGGRDNALQVKANQFEKIFNN